MSKTPPSITIRSWVLTLLVVGVLLVWGINILAGLVVSGWQGDPGVNGVMAALLGLLGVLGGKSLFARAHSSEGDSPPEVDPEEGGGRDR